MKWSELPQEYRDLDIGTNFDDLDYLDQRFEWGATNQGYDFWKKCHTAKTIYQLPPIQKSSMIFDKGWEDEEGVKFVLPKKWCIKGEPNGVVHNWFNDKLNRKVFANTSCYFHLPEIKRGMCTAQYISLGYMEVSLADFEKYVLNPDLKNVNLVKELLQELREEENERDNIARFYMIYVDGQTGSNFKHKTLDSAEKEAERLSNLTDKEVYILKSILYLNREVIIRKSLL